MKDGDDGSLKARATRQVLGKCAANAGELRWNPVALKTLVPGVFAALSRNGSALARRRVCVLCSYK